MSQPAATLDLQLPDDWQPVAEPPAGASMQAYAPVEGAFRGSITIHAYAQAEPGDGPPPINEIHAAQVEDALGALPDSRRVGDTATTVGGMAARVADIAFTQEAFSVIARIWTIQAPTTVLAVDGLYEVSQAERMVPVLDQIVNSITVTG